MAEVQCWEGDGVVPPEVAALIKENEDLKERVNDRDRTIRRLEKTVEDQERMLQSYGGKLRQIQKIVQEPDVIEEEKYTNSNPVEEQISTLMPSRYDDMMEKRARMDPSPMPSKSVKTAQEMFDMLMRKDDRA